jgi:Leucine-rich repeat (LRR) protein
MGTGWLSPVLTGFLNTKFATNWWVQKQIECVTDGQLSVTTSWSLLSGNIMTFNVTVVNSGIRWSYNNKVTLTLNQGLIISGWANTLNYNILAPGASQTLTFTILKSGATPATPTTGVSATATFVLTDPTINDLTTGNNTVVVNPIVRWSTRPVCYSPALNIPNYECDALMDLFHSTNSTGWTTKTNWGSGTDVEAWYGITLTGTTQKYVDKICLADETEVDACRNHWEVINGNGLSGTIPSTLSLLSESSFINFNKNNLTGSLPASFGPKIKQILLANNQLTGSIPTTWGSMTQLTWIAIEFNNLNGAIPSQLTTTSLTHFRWDNNRFTSLPDLSAEALVILELSGNLLSWPLPTWIGWESTLSGLQLNNNSFVWPIPSNWNWLTNIRSLELQYNQLTGNLNVFAALSVSNWNVLRINNNNLDRDHNNDAIVPANIQARLAGMTSQNLTNQWDITAPVVSGTGVIGATVTGEFNYTLTVNENSSTTGAWFTSGLNIIFTGNSACIQALNTTWFITNKSGLVTFQVAVFELGTFVGCQIMTKDRAWLSSNIITLPTFFNNEYGVCTSVGDVPKSDCRALMDLYVATNGSGWTNKTYWRWIWDTASPTTICDWFGIKCGWARVTHVCLNNSGSGCNNTATVGNNLSGTIPTSINDLTALTTIQLQYNNLTWSLSSLTGLTSLTQLYLQNNNLNWSTPQLPAASNLMVNLTSNKFTTLSSGWCSVTTLSWYDIDTNLLVGILPSCLPKFATGAILDLSSNQIAGNLPSTWSGVLGTLNLSGNLLTGAIPSSWGTWFPSLTVLSLASNNLQWFIPNSFTWLANLTNSASYLNNNCLSPSPTYMSAWLQTTLANKFNNRWTQKNCQWTIDGEVWIDTNLNGIHDGWELGTWSVTVTLRRCADQTSTWWFDMILGYNGSVVTSATSAANGSYSFASLTPHYNAATVNSGKYYFEYTNIPNWYKFTTQRASSNWQATNDSNTNTRSAKSDCFELYNGLTVTGVDAGIKYLPYSSCDTVAPTYTPVLLWEPVTFNVVWYGTNGQIIVRNGAATVINQIITNQWTNWASKTWSYPWTSTVTGTLSVSWLVDGFDYKTDFYESVASTTAYKVIATNQRCAVQVNMWVQNSVLTNINQIATIPAPILYCTPAQISWLPDATANNYPPKMLVRVPSCTSTVIVTDDPKFMCNFITDADPAECDALVDLYNTTKWATWTTKTNWLFKSDTTAKTICDWTGITCAGNRVVSINLPANGLTGTIGSFPWSTFTQLSGLILNNNNLTWSLPTWLVMPTLRTIKLWYNGFTGSLPTQWGSVSWLVVVSLTNWWLFSWSIPTSWSGLTNLEQLHLSNTLTGTRAFPSQVTSWTKIKELHLDNLGIVGAISSWLSNLTWLQSLQLQDNFLDKTLTDTNWQNLSALYTSAHGGIKSALDNNCLYTGWVSGALTTFMDARFNFASLPTTNWRNQTLCPTDLQLTAWGPVWNLTTGLTMDLLIDYQNNWPLTSYNPIITIQLYSWLNLTIGSGNFAWGSTTGIRVPSLEPWQTGRLTITINKMMLGSGLVETSNTFSISDPTRLDVVTPNNNLSANIWARGSTYPICNHPQINIQSYECESLGDLYTYTNGANWTTKTNWLLNTDVDLWHGITLVNLTWVNYVQKICLGDETESDACNYPHSTPAGNGNNLSWNLIFTIGDLSQLTTLNLSNNNINGAIPAQVTSLDKVTDLGLYNTKINNLGTWVAGMSWLRLLWATYSPNLTSLPSNLDQATSLRVLDLYNNNLTSVPALTSLSDTLTGLDLSANPLVNTTIPSWLAWFTSLQTLNFSGVQLTWQLGTTLDTLTALHTLNLANNNLTWSLTSTLSSLINLSWLSLQSNKFINTLPTTWSSLTKLTRLTLQDNPWLTGSLPASWSGMRLLQTLNLSWWAWVGQIPSSWMPVMTGMRDFIIPNAQLDGPVPATWFQLWTSLRTWPITSTINNNCLYTWSVTGAQATFMNTYMSWTTQKKCNSDLQITLTSKSAADYNPGRTITYTINYANNWPRWSYEPKITALFNSGIMLSGTSITWWVISLPMLMPGQTWQVTITANKRGSGSGIVTYTNTFSIADATTTDLITGNNALVDSGLMKLFKYNECIDIVDVPQLECEALMDVYMGTNGAWWTSGANWAGNSDSTIGTLCDWYGVSCTTSGSSQTVSQINLINNNLSGNLSDSLANLTNLTWLSTSGNINIIWSFPVIGTLSKLQTLSFYNNRMTGPIPTTLTWMTVLTTLALTNNAFNWSIPSNLFTLPNLTTVLLNNAGLSGPLPASGTSPLVTLNLAANALNWSIPTWITTRTTLQNLYLNNNQLAGVLPTTWSSMTILQNIDLGSNLFNGTIPTQWSAMSWIKDLRINNNSFTGSLPWSWSGLSNLEYLDVSSGGIWGTLPSSWSSLANLRTLRLSNNTLTDEVPAAWFTGMTSMQSFVLSNNNLWWVISLPSPWQSLSTLTTNNSSITNNCLYTGTVVWWAPAWMDNYYTSSWRTQRKCVAQLQLSGMTVVGNMMSGAFMTYTLTYQNNGPSRAYLPQVTATLYTWFNFVNGGGTTSGINVWYIKPYTSGSVSIQIVKIAVWSGVAPFTNTFTLSDTASTDPTTGNITITHTGTLTLFKYPICTSITDIDQAECEALWDLYTFTNGASWSTKTNWMWVNGETTTDTACDWYGVTCANSATGSFRPKTVTNLCLSSNNITYACNYAPWDIGGIGGNNLSGTLSYSLGDLKNLTRLVLSGNPKLVGTLPSSISQLSGVQTLGVMSWWLNGVLPSFAGMNSLVILALSSNKLTWSLPSDIFTLPQLSFAYLSSNTFNGSLPVAGTSPLTQLFLGNNQLSWPLPSWLASRTSLTTLDLQLNKLTGPIPTTWSALTNIQNLYLNNNLFTGALPTTWSTLTQLQNLDIGTNTGITTGSIPTWIFTNTGLVSLWLNAINLTGVLPSSWSALTKLTTLELDTNWFNGQIPSSWSSLTGLTKITLSNNDLEWLIPWWFSTGYVNLWANSSTINNNCMYTGYVTGTFLTNMNTRFGSNWQTHKICATDPALVTLATTWNLLTGNTITHTLTYRNNGPRWSYLPRITLVLGTWLQIGNSSGTLVSSLVPLAPNQTWSLVYIVNKRWLTTSVVTGWTNTFTISDTTIADTSGWNNTLSTTGTAKWSIYPICLDDDLTVSQAECEALMDFYTFNNWATSWTNKTGWNMTGNVDAWFGVTLSGGRVTKINMTSSTNDSVACSTVTAGNNITGTISNSLQSLPYLTELCLGNNPITWWPINTNTMTWLKVLSLHHAAISSIPYSLTWMASLQTLDLSFNNLTGAIDLRFGGLASLKNLYLNNNQLSTGLSFVTNYWWLTGLRLHNNLFTGTLPTAWSSLNSIVELTLDNNYFDRDHINEAIIPSALTTWYANITGVKTRANQWDTRAPIISAIGSVPSSVTGVSFTTTMTINENSYASWLYTAGIYNGQTHSWLYLTFTWAWYCSTLSADPVRNHSGVVTLVIYPETDGTYTSCQLTLRDRANNISNSLTLWNFTYTQPPYRLHLRMSWSGITLLSNTPQSINDLSSFAHVITMAGWAPIYSSTALNENPAIQLNNGQSLMMPGIFRKQQFNDVTILMVAKPWSSSSSLLLEQALSGFPVSLSTNAWTVWSNTSTFSLPQTQHSLITASHSNGWSHKVRLNGTDTNSVSATQALQVSGISVTTIWSWFAGWSLWEAIIYTKSLNASELNFFESYLALKYGITLPWDYVAPNPWGSINTIWSANPSYQYQVIWLGRHMSTALPFNQTSTSTSAFSGTIMLHARGTRTDGQYAMVGSNSGALTWTRAVPMTWYGALERTWYVKKSWGNPSFDISVTPSSIAEFTFAPTILVSNDPNFSTIVWSWLLVNSNGRWVSTWVTINDGQYVTFAVAQGVIGGRVWLDLNRDGVQSPSEPSLAWVTVKLWQCSSANTQPIYIWSAQASTGPVLAQLTTTADQDNIIFTKINPGKYYMTYEFTWTSLNAYDAWSLQNPLLATTNEWYSPWWYNGWSTWSDYESYMPWKNNSSSLWYGSGMANLSGVLLTSIDSDMVASGMSFLAQSSKCYPMVAWSNLQGIGAWLMLNNNTDLHLTGSLSTWSIANTSWATFSLTVSASNLWATFRSHHTQIVTQIPSNVSVVQVVTNPGGAAVPYIVSWSSIKVYHGILNPGATQWYRIDLVYNGQADDGAQFTFASQLQSTTIDTNTSNNAISLNQAVTLTKNGSTIGDTLWIDGNNNGIQDDGANPIVSWVKLELMSSPGNAVIKTRYTSSVWSYSFNSVAPGSYYIRVSNLPRWYVATLTGAGTSGTDNNVRYTTINTTNGANESNVFVAVNGVDDLSIDIGLKSIDALNSCSNSSIPTHKLRIGQSYYGFTDNYTPSAVRWTRLFDVTRVWYEYADYNSSSTLPSLNIYNNGSWSTVWNAWLLWYIPVLGLTQTVVGNSSTNPYVVSKAAVRGLTGQMLVQYQYVWCYVNSILPASCVQWFRYTSCHNYEITSCGDGIVDTYNSTDYIWSNRWAEECDNGPANGPANTCTSECKLNIGWTADLGISKTDVVRKSLPQGSDGVFATGGSWSGSLATLVNGSVSTSALIVPLGQN